MALINPRYIDCVVALGSVINGESRWLGTGFLYGDLLEKTQDGRNKYSIYLVTNKHVLADLDNLWVRFNSRENKSAKDYQTFLRDKDGRPFWTGHPDPEVDVAVFPVLLNNILQEGMKADFFRSDHDVADVNELLARGTSEGDGVFALGFPMGIVADDRQHVFVRGGVISRITDMFEGRSTDFVVDAFTFPGNSGGPVLSKPEFTNIDGTKPSYHSSLIGINKAYIPYSEVAISQQTNKPRVIFEENTGLSVVEPVDHIIATIKEAGRQS